MPLPGVWFVFSEFNSAMDIPRFRSLLPKVSQTIKQFRCPIGNYALILFDFGGFILEVTCSSRLYVRTSEHSL